MSYQIDVVGIAKIRTAGEFGLVRETSADHESIEVDELPLEIASDGPIVVEIEEVEDNE